MAMKRKLDENGAPTVEVPAESKPQSFDNLNLDPRLLEALAKSKYAEPTPVQAKVIPLAGQGANILARSKPGSGKTAAYILPCLQSILQSKAQSSSGSKAISVLVLTPSIELSNQVTREFVKLAEFCGKDVRALNLAQDVSDTVLGAKVNEGPDILVSTPSRVAKFLAKGALDLSNLQKLVVDEADLVLGYGQPEDIEKISKTLPTGVQVLLVSATLTEEVTQLRETFAGSSFTMVDIEDQEEKVQDVAQYVVKCGEEEKFLLIYVMFKLKLAGKRSIVFVDDVDRSYRLKLFLEQFGIRSCILNHELPVNSRLHAVQEFNKGLYDILIAADDQEVIGGVQKKAKKAAVNDNEEAVEEREQSASEAEEEQQPVPKNSKRGNKKDYGVSRGIDFQNVSSVINFDLPSSSKSYTHRVGRTARAGKSGMAISFVIPKDEFGKHKYTSISSSRHDERVLEKIRTRQAKKGKELQDYNFNMAQVEGFRYRMQDALKAVTPNKIREARTREIKQELLKSEKLAKHFEENPEDLKALRHDTSSSAGVIRVHSHMKSVPEYMLPGGSKKQKTGHNGFVSFNKPGKEKDKKRRSFKGKKPTGKRLDPLKSFKAKRK